MSERDGSDKQQLWMMIFSIDLKSIEDDVIQIQILSMSDPTLSDIHCNYTGGGRSINSTVAI